MPDERRSSLPRHAVPTAVRTRGTWHLAVSGLVDQPGELSLEALLALPRVTLTDDFRCEEGWQVPGLVWSGVALRDVLALAGVRPEGRHVRVGSGDFYVTLPWDEIGADRPLLADTLNDAPLTVEHGAPLRLIAPGNACFSSIKWVDRIAVLAEPDGADTAPILARDRLRSR
ncbi:MAG TPA: molybdopterin-dependent oxidoreductase [Dehalococcoidia bacterium]|nr:molybdopterin-dependent oxidoreductase [Dehalococcoidia bacterium]